MDAIELSCVDRLYNGLPPPRMNVYQIIAAAHQTSLQVHCSLKNFKRYF